MSYKVYLLSFFIILLTACSTVEEILTPEGEIVYRISCDGEGLDWDDCYNKADKVCEGRGYTFVRRNHGRFDSEIATAEAAQNIAGYGENISRYTFIRCK